MTSPLINAAGEGTSASEEVVREFASQLRGHLIRPSDDGYDSARAVWNGFIDKRPALIARCAGTADVITAVHFARQYNLPVAVRGGGHNVAGFATCDGGLVIDLSAMKGTHVDVEARTARVEAGVTWGELDHETQMFGLATPGGLVSETGVAGLTLSGGLGWLRRKYGLSCDNLVSVDLVTASGRLLKASQTHNADLFWGIRGGGGNFGIVTSFEYRLYPVGPEIMFSFVLYPRRLAPEALRLFREYTMTAPDEVSVLADLGTVPSTPMFPPEVQGEPHVLFAACYVGDVEEGARVMRPLRELATPLADFSAPVPYVEMQRIFDEDYPAGKLRYYWKSLNLKDMSDETISELLAWTQQCPSALSTVDIWHLGGAVLATSDILPKTRRRQLFMKPHRHLIDD